MEPIIPIRRKDPFDDPTFLYEVKFDGFRGIADTVHGRMLSKNKSRMRRFERLLALLPSGYVFDGEIVALAEDGRPTFRDLMFAKREPSYVAFDILFHDGADVRELPLKTRKSLLESVVRRNGMERCEHFLGEGKALFRATCKFDLEGIVAKRLSDPYRPESTRWWKILNPGYSQKTGRHELFNTAEVRSEES